MVRLERTVDDTRFEVPVVLFRVSLAAAADGPEEIEVADSIPVADADVAFPEATTRGVEWTVEDGRPTATLTLDTGESVVTGYAVRDVALSLLERGSAEARTVEDHDGGTGVGRRTAAAALVVLLIVAAGAGGALLLDGPGPESASADGPDGTSAEESPTATPRTATDTDGDGLNDTREDELGTDPTAVDTDGDDLNDARELALDTDPMAADTDNDDLNDTRELALGTDPTLSDSDEDGLSDPTELNGPTPVTDPDADGDGLPDGAEAGSEVLPGADPLRMDVYVEIDRTGDLRLSEEQRERLVGIFADAPVENPGNRTGIALHLFRDDTLPPVDVLNESAFDYYREHRADRSCMGYHYAVLAPNANFADGTDRDITGGVAALGGGAFTSEASTFTFLHELGHSLGLDHGPDVPYSAYPSAMNYNIRRARYDFSDGTASAQDRDDWEFLQEQMATPPVTHFSDPFVTTCTRPGDQP